MTEDGDGEDGSENKPAGGRRKDGQPYKDGNTRDDGSYATGKYRPPAQHQFAKGDGRARGKRKKGGKNADKIWKEKLSETLVIEGKRQTSLQWVIDREVKRAIVRGGRSVDLVLAAANRLEAKDRDQLGVTDEEILAAFLSQSLRHAPGSISDDHDARDLDEQEADYEG